LFSSFFKKIISYDVSIKRSPITYCGQIFFFNFLILHKNLVQKFWQKSTLKQKENLVWQLASPTCCLKMKKHEIMLSRVSHGSTVRFIQVRLSLPFSTHAKERVSFQAPVVFKPSRRQTAHSSTSLYFSLFIFLLT
jgi:hypothetical protein